MSVLPVQNRPAASQTDAEAVLASPTSFGQSPVSSIIRPQLWVHWIITVLCMAAWGGMLYLGDLAERDDFGLRDILGIRSGRLTTFFSTIMLLWAGQLSLLIYWYRRKSRNDFAGRYRMWLWITGILQMFLAVAATGAHVSFAQYMQRIWPLGIPGYALLCWLVPVSTLSLAMYRLLRMELKRHRSGRWLLNLAGCAAIVAATSLVIGPFLPERWRDLVEIGSATLAHLGLATALLMHARYVIHISNEVPRKERRARRLLLSAARHVAASLPIPRAPRLRLPTLRLPGLKLSAPKLPGVPFPGLRILRFFRFRFALPSMAFPRLRVPTFKLPRLPRIKLPSLRSSSSRPGREATSKGVQAARGKQNKQQKSRAAASRSDAPQTLVASVPKKNPSTANSNRQRLNATPPPKGPRRQQPQRSLDDILSDYGVDDDAGDESTRGLSKKERRRLRKKQRELQRSSH